MNEILRGFKGILGICEIFLIYWSFFWIYEIFLRDLPLEKKKANFLRSIYVISSYVVVTVERKFKKIVINRRIT